jgi:hypothetical protein
MKRENDGGVMVRWVALGAIGLAVLACSSPRNAFQKTTAALRTAPSLSSAAGTLCFHGQQHEWPYGPDGVGWVHTLYPQAHAVLGATTLPTDSSLAATTELEFQLARAESSWDIAANGPRAQVCADLDYANPCNYVRACWKVAGGLIVTGKKSASADSCGTDETTYYDVGPVDGQPPTFPPLAFEHTYRLALRAEGAQRDTWKVSGSVDGVPTPWTTIAGTTLDGDPGFSGFAANRVTVRARLLGSGADGAPRGISSLAIEGSSLGASAPIVCGYYDQAPAALPAPPTGLQLVSTDSCKLQLSVTWNGVSGAQSYQLYRDGLKMFPTPDWGRISAGTQVNKAAIYPSAHYRYNIAWYDSSGLLSDKSEPIDVTMPAPCARPEFDPNPPAGDLPKSLGVGVVLLRFADASPGPYDAAHVEQALFSPTNQPTSLKTWVSETSRASATVDGDVLRGTNGDWITMTNAQGQPLNRTDILVPSDQFPSTPFCHSDGTYFTCYNFEFGDFWQMAQRGGAHGPDPSRQYEKYVFLIHGDTYTGAGLADSTGIPGVRVSTWQGNPSLGVILHELIGHALGLEHSGQEDCDGAAAVPPDLVDTDGPCNIIMYGDGMDPMGGGDSTMYHTMNLYRLGWLADAEVAVDQQGGTYTVAKLGAATATKQLRVPLDENTFYFVEYRSNQENDADSLGACSSCNPITAGPSFSPGVLVRLYRNSVLADHVTTPNGSVNSDSSLTVNAGTLQPGDSFVDAYRGVTIRYESQTTVGASPAGVVTVTRNPPVQCPDLDQNGVQDCKETLVANPGLNVNVASWTPGDGSVGVSRSSADASGMSASGSIAVDDTTVLDADGATTASANQCVAVVDGATYATARYLMPTAQAGQATATLILQYYGSADCSGTAVDAYTTPAGGATDAWSRLEGTHTAPAGAHSMLVRLAVTKPSRQATTRASFDDVLVRVGTCVDGLPNGSETDVDCGGGICQRCGMGKHCSAAADCSTAVCVGNACGCATGADCPAGFTNCVAGVCQPDISCTNRIKDGSETDVDCGGSCQPCAPGQQCATGADCTATVCNSGTCGCVSTTDCPAGTADCVAGVCRPASCGDNVKDGTETDVDCGGPSCPLCTATQTCSTGWDCTTGICRHNTCGCGTLADCPAGYTRCFIGLCDKCNDNVKDLNETDVDCGGGSCVPCGLGKQCTTGTDCMSTVCLNGVCSSCGNNVKDGNETDVDCGGGTCGACYPGKHCSTYNDCTSQFCLSGTCRCTGPADCPAGYTRCLAGYCYQ